MKLKSSTVPPILVLALIIQATLLINGSALFGPYWSEYEPILTIYILLDAVLLPLSLMKIIPFLEITISDAIIVFIPTFLIGGFLFQFLFRTSPITVPVENFFLDFIFQIFVVAFTEEMIFRGVLLQYNLGPIPGWVWTGTAFGFAHLNSYTTRLGLDWGALMIAILMGCLFGLIVTYFSKMNLSGVGLTITWALHSAWNVALTTTIFTLMIFSPNTLSIGLQLTFLAITTLLFIVVFIKFKHFENVSYQKDGNFQKN
jgi:membrane protease YdiL (CAAX protease family)